MTEWREVALGDLGDVITGGTPAARNADWFGDETPFITPTDIGASNRRAQVARWLSRTGRVGLKKKVLPPCSVCFVCIGATIGKLCLTDADAVTNQQINSIVPNSSVDPLFLYYLLRHEAPRIAQTAGGAATPITNKTAFSNVAVRVPDPGTQAQIGLTLGALDDLIENNRRRVAVLEEMARAIYREWFVHFRFPGHEHVELVDSGLGPIPAGWSVDTVARLCSRIQAGATPKRSEPAYWADAEVDWYKTGDLTDSVLIHSSEQISTSALSKGRVFEPETILMAIYGSPTVGRLGLVASTSSANRAALGLSADKAVATTEFLWFVLAHLRGHLNAIAQGAAQQNVSKEKVAAASIVLPPRSLVAEFTDAVRSPWRLSHVLQREASSLCELRDALLPKLVTGQIDVSSLDLDSLVEDAVA